NAVRGERCRETGLWLISSDVTGERDGRVAWGPTAVLNPEGQVVAQLPLEEPGLQVSDRKERAFLSSLESPFAAQQVGFPVAANENTA
ncbi:hypothetical protein AB9E13_34105, partial [Rhizobium leguminosarum]